MLRKIVAMNLLLACAFGMSREATAKTGAKDETSGVHTPTTERLYLFSPERSDGSVEVLPPEGQKAPPMPEAPLLKLKADGTIHAKAVIAEPAARRD